MDIDQFQTRLMQAIMDVDRSRAQQITEDALQHGLSNEQYINSVLDPVLLKMGNMWGNKQVSLAQAFVGSKIAEDVMTRCLPSVGSIGVQKTKGVVVIGNIEDDFHSLGRGMVSSFLRASGWVVHDLGNDVTAEEFVNKAIEVNAPIIGASAMMQTTALHIKKLRMEINQRNLQKQIKLAVGGAVFNWRPELVAEVGGDGSAPNAAAVDALFTKFLNELGLGGNS